MNKSEEFSIEDNQIAALAKALSHPARIAIIKLLIEKQTCICGDIVLELPLSQSTVSQHLKELKTAGLIKGTIDGLKVCYCLNFEVLSKFVGLLTKLNSNVTNNCC
jgi:DNA-binding transcriptional ArsR family regulator